MTSEDKSPVEASECEQIVDQIYAYLDGELSPSEGERLKAHLEECPPCLDEYQRDVLLKALLRRSCGQEAAPPQLRTQIIQRITTVTSTSYSHVEIRREF